MKKTLFFLILFQAVLTAGFSQVYRPFTPRFTAPSVRGNIVYVSNNTITSPARNATENPPGGTSVNDTTLATYIDIDALETIIPWNTSWKVRDSAYVAGAPSTNWKLSSWNDAGWQTMNTGLPSNPNRDIGYGDGDETTPYLYSGCGARPGVALPLCATKYWTSYFRKQFTITNIADYERFTINLHRDDGAVVYINGIEVARSNMPAGVINYNTAASSGVEGANEDVTIVIPKTHFLTGTNLIAVEIHQRAVGTLDDGVDLSFRLQLLGDKTFSSSSANLDLPNCSQVLWAGLYWGAATNDILGGTSTMAWINKEDSIKLKVPGAADYTIVTSTQTDYHDQIMIYGRRGTGYRCFADITSLLNGSNPDGTYWIGNLLGPHNMQNGSGGWTIVVAYANSTLSPRNLTVFDGNAVMSGGDPPLIVGVGGFLTPPGGPVSCELGAIVYDGDRVSGDEFSFKQDSNRLVGTYTNLTPNATSNLNDMWNSTISYKGNNVTTRNPAHRNTLGYDADIIDVPNSGNSVLGNNRTSASIRFSSTFENYFIHVFSTSISIYSPSFAFEKTATDLSGGTVVPGDSLEYEIEYDNVGNDASNNTVITDNIPAGTSYIPGTIEIEGNSKTDVSGDDEAEYDIVNNRIVFRVGTGATSAAGGSVADGDHGKVKFNVVLASSCAVISCINPIRNTARLSYTAQTSGMNSEDSSGIKISGCVTQGASSSTTVGACVTNADTIITNRCPDLHLYIPFRKYGGYRIYSAKPFIPANLYDPAIPVTYTRTFWAYVNNGPGCNDTVRINAYILGCPDIDDDNDGIPDYVEVNITAATQDANSNGVPNWNDASYAGFVDNNFDSFNDNFDPGADHDNDGIPNYYDVNFPLYLDANGDRMNDRMDMDKDGIPNHLDLDSDNDGIPDVVEAYGVDTDGDGRIDNYTDVDLDGFSQNVDANTTGVPGSANGLGVQHLDTDNIPNYLDLDSDADGIPDVIESAGSDANNDGFLDSYSDTDLDGFSDNVDGDVGNDSISENSSNTLVRTGPDVSPVNGRADNYPYKNFDNDSRINAYDLDSDMDGIVDVIEGGLSDTNFDGYADGAAGLDGWNTTVNALVAYAPRNTDGRAGADYLDIDSDDDGIPDNIEGQTTAGYRLPAYADTDNDGIDNIYDNLVTFGGRGVFISDKDGDNLPDYRDLDTDADGKPDIFEGNDFNLDTHADDDVALTLLDTDGDGLDNKFDSLNSVTNIKGTSYRMGNNGTFTGDPAPGSRTVVQRSMPILTDRDWRAVGYVLNVDILEFTVFAEEYNNTLLNWTLTTSVELDRFEIERSTDNVNFIKVGTLVKSVALNETQTFATNDDISDVSGSVIYYRLKIIGVSGMTKYSDVRAIRKNVKKAMVNIFPNPANDKVTIQVYTDKAGEGTIRIIDNTGRIVSSQKEKLIKGNNVVTLRDLSKFSNGVYNFQCLVETDVIIKKISIQNP